jgi:polar amino acid transport system substrate-binding protein
LKERQQQVDLIDYLRGGTQLIVPAGDSSGVRTPADLCGKTVAYLKGSFQQAEVPALTEKCRAAGKRTIRSQVYDDSNGVTLSVQSRRADVAWIDYPAAVYLLKTVPDTFALAGPPQLFGLYAVAVPKDSPQVKGALRAALQELVRRGLYQKVLAKWGVTRLAVSRIEVNAAEI